MERGEQPSKIMLEMIKAVTEAGKTSRKSLD
jgi:hypothetical protein